MTNFGFLIVFDIFLGLSAISIHKNCSLLNPCMNLAKCSDENGIQCHCSRGFSGSLCEKWPRECLSDFCLNEGTCVMTRQIPRCVCQPGSSGVFCEISLSTAPVSTTTSPLEATWLTENTTVPLEANTTMVAMLTTIEPEPKVSETTSGQNFSLVHQELVKSGVDNLKNSICDYHPCLNNGECINLNDTEYKFYCACPENFAGLLCEKIVPNTTPARQVKEKLSEIGESDVQAEPEDTNAADTTNSNIFIITEQNELKISRQSFCASMKPCQNNGQCVDLEPSLTDPRTFMCLCTDEHMGTFCHIKKMKGICSINPCFNLGTCIPSVDNKSYACQCQNGFSGDNCELKIILKN